MSSRIKDITTTATAAADDDYLVIDGATNGTRKILSSNVGGGKMYDYTCLSGSSLSLSSSLYRAFVVSDLSVLTPDNYRKIKVYGVGENNSTYVFTPFDMYKNGSEGFIIRATSGLSSATSMVLHVEAPFEIIDDHAMM